MAESGDTDTAANRVAQALGLSETDIKEYWQRNLKLIFILMVVWFAVSFFAAILIAPSLANIRFGQLPAAFWFAQQGSIMVFVILIFIYVWQMNKLDREYGVEDVTDRDTEVEG